MSVPADTTITAETPEGIAIAIRPAGFPVRAAAFLLDGLIRTCVVIALLSGLGRIGRFGMGASFIIVFIANWLYPMIFELSAAAATPGKRVMGLQVMMANGLPLTPAGCVIRNLMRVVDLLPLMYASAIVLVLLRHDSRRLGDLAGGTIVAYRNEVMQAGAFGRGDPLPSPVVLTPRQQAAVAAFAWRAGRLTPARAEEIARLAAGTLPSIAARGRMADGLTGIARWLHGERRAAAAASASASAAGEPAP